VVLTDPEEFDAHLIREHCLLDHVADDLRIRDSGARGIHLDVAERVGPSSTGAGEGADFAAMMILGSMRSYEITSDQLIFLTPLRSARSWCNAIHEPRRYPCRSMKEQTR
jgi:hypothetical protein